VRPRQLTALLGKIKRVRLVVVGDPCLDENVYGRAEEVAKEAPVIALEAGRPVYAPGQATNVAANAAALGATVSFMGVAGADEKRARLVLLLEEMGVDAAGLVAERGRVTTHKMKFVGRESQRHTQHIFHAYWQERRSPTRATMRALRAAAARALDNADAVVLSDYGNGSITSSFTGWFIGESRRRGVVSAANARGDVRAFRGLTLVVANVEELTRLAGRRAVRSGDMTAAMEVAARKLAARYVVITAGEEGMFVWPVRGRARHIHSAAREVVDVTGGGDTVTAALAVALGAGAGLGVAAAFANLAAAAVVSREGTAIARAKDLIAYSI